jgi:thioredoxin-related protein
MKKIIFILALFILPMISQAQSTKIKWMSFEEAVKKAEKNPKKIFMDMYTDWCGWCVKMDESTFSNAVIAAYINQNFYPVKFDAERSDTVVFEGKTFVNPSPGKKRSSHQLAQALMQGKMSYPSYVIMGEDLKVISVVPGFFPADQFEPVLHFFGTNAYKTTEWPSFNKSFVGKVAKD